MKKLRRIYKRLPSAFKILLLNFGITALTFAITDIEDGILNYIDYAKIAFGALINILVHLKLKEEKENGNN